MPKIVDHDAKRSSIIETGMAYYMESGLKSFNIDELAKRMDIGKGTIYHYFESREVILSKVLEATMRQSISKARAVIENKKSAKEKLIVLFSVYTDDSQESLKMREKYLEYISIVMEANPKYSFEKHDCIGEFNGIVFEVVKNGIKDKEFLPIASELAKSLIATADGMLIYASMNDAFELEKEFKQYLETMLKLILIK